MFNPFWDLFNEWVLSLSGNALETFASRDVNIHDASLGLFGFGMSFFVTGACLSRRLRKMVKD